MMERFYNPVLVKELKLRFRSFKSFSGLMFYLAVLCIFIAGFLLLTTEFTGRGFFKPETSFYDVCCANHLANGISSFHYTKFDSLVLSVVSAKSKH